MSGDGWYQECPDCGYDEANCMCDDPNFVDDRWLDDEEARERLRDEDAYLYAIPAAVSGVAPATRPT